MGRPGWPELACSTASTDRKRMVLIASSSRLDCVMLGPLLVVSSRTAGPPSRDILPLALLAELPVRSVLPSRSQRALMSASPFGAMPAIRSFQDATNELARQPGGGPGHAAAPASARQRPCAASRSTLQPSPPHDQPRGSATGGWSKASWRDRGPGAAVTVDTGPLTNWMGDAGFPERPYAEVRTPAIHGDTTWHQGTVTGKAEGGVVKLRITGIDQVGITTTTSEAEGVLPSRAGRSRQRRAR